jgi:MFS family permease
VLQALGAAMVMAVGPVLIMKAFPGKERGRALGFNATIVALGLLAGPGLGGVLLAHFGWSFIFYVNLPVGAAGLLVSHLALPRERPVGGQTLDMAGAALFAVGMTAFLSGISHGSDWGWETLPVLACGGITLLCLTGFLFAERRALTPIIDLAVVSRPLFLLPSLAASGAYMASYAVNLLLPFYLNGQLALDPKLMGALLTASPALVVVVAPVSGWLSERIRPSYLAALGLLIMGLGMLAQAHLDASSGLARVAAGQLLIGLGFGIFSSPNNNTILCSVPAEKSGLAGGLLALTRNLGMVCGIAMATSIFESVNAASGAGNVFFPGFKAALLASAGLVFAAALLSLARARLGGEEEVVRADTVLLME